MNESSGSEPSGVLLYGPTTSSTIRSDGTREGIFREPEQVPSSNPIDMSNVSEVAHSTSSPQEATQAFDNKQPIPGVFVTAEQTKPENVQPQPIDTKPDNSEKGPETTVKPNFQNIEKFVSQHNVLETAEQNKTLGNEAGENEKTILDTKDRVEQELRDYDKSLKVDRPMTEEEIRLLKESFLNENPEYSKTKEGYEEALKSGHIRQNDLDYLKNRLDEEYQQQFINRFGDEKGNITTKSCSIVDLNYLYSKKQEETTKKFVTTENLPKKTEEQPVKKEEEIAKEKKEPIRDRKERNLSRKAIIGLGIASGVGFSVVGGAATFPMASIVAGIGGMTSVTVERFVSSKYSSNLLKLQSVTDPEQKTKLEKTIQKQEKMMKIAGNVAQFLRGFTIGSFVGGLATKIYMSQVAVNQLNSLEQQPSASPDNTPLSQQPSTSPENILTGQESNVQPENVLVQDGRVNLPGSAWNGNLAGEAVGNLPGGAENFSNYTGGWHEMAPRMLEEDLVSSGITRDTLMNNLNTSEIHGLINGYLADIQGGISNPDLVQNLSKLGTEGAKNLISMLSGK